MKGLDQWLQNNPDDTGWTDYTEYFERNWGRAGHGLAGKDADLDAGGQIKVLCAGIDTDNGKAVAKVHAYACVVPADESQFWPPNESNQGYAEKIAHSEWEQYMEFATDVVCGETAWSGEWDGDYWVFTMEKETTVSIDLSADDEWDSKEGLDKILTDLCNAIFEACRPFREAMADLDDAITKENYTTYLNDVFE